MSRIPYTGCIEPGPEEGADQTVAHQGEQDDEDVTPSEQGQLSVEGAPDR
jgi:hypothetical protein